MRSNRITLTCPRCEIAFDVKASQAARRKYCSTACLRDDQADKTRRVCPTCGDEFHDPDNTIKAKQTYCSRACGRAAVRGERSPHWKGGIGAKRQADYEARRKKHHCKICETPISDLRLEYCSDPCRSEGHRRVAAKSIAKDPQRHERREEWRNFLRRRERAEISRRYHFKLKIQAFNNYGGPSCRCCGETIIQFLTIDHIDGGGSRHRKSINATAGVDFYRWLRTNGYPKGYQVLCFNCNCAKGYFGACPHQELGEQLTLLL